MDGGVGVRRCVSCALSCVVVVLLYLKDGVYFIGFNLRFEGLP